MPVDIILAYTERQKTLFFYMTQLICCNNVESHTKGEDWRSWKLIS